MLTSVVREMKEPRKLFKDNKALLCTSRKMARSAATNKTAATPAPAAPATPAPATKKADAKAAAPAPKVAEKPAAAPVAETPAAEGETPVNPVEEISTKLTSLVTSLKELQALVKTLSKDYEKMRKTVQKTERKRANARSNPNGFAKPAKVVDELCDFCGVTRGTLMSRTDVTRAINAYIKEKNLNDPKNKRNILPDDKLRNLLKLKTTDELNFFKLQAYLSPLFVKNV